MTEKRFRRRSVPTLMRAFFDSNPKEELTVPDAETKFDACRSSVHKAIKDLPELEYVSVIRRKESR